MNIHEFQAKELLASYQVPVPAGKTVHSVEEVPAAIRELGGSRWLVKAQIHAGARGKAGGVVVVETVDEARQETARLLGSRLATVQTDPGGLPVNAVLIETATDIARELYLSVLIDRGSERVTFVASAAGGMDIEELATQQPEAIFRFEVNPAVGFSSYQGREMAFGLGLDAKKTGVLVRLLAGLYRLLQDKDAGQIEINPLALTSNGDLVALDAKLNFDDNALYAHPDIEALRDPSQEDEKERRAREHDLSYVTLEGVIGCMVNGAGLAMATMDLVKQCGGEPANFLDVGGGASAERVTEAFKIILSDTKVKAILVNIFGGIVRCDLIAEGIIEAVKEVHVGVPVVVRLEGTNADEGRRLLERSGLAIIAANDLLEAARKAVAAAQGEA